jgi:ribosomal protein S18 acetylase RimI-like enzyme
VATEVEIRRLAREDLSLIAQIDRTERIEVLYEQRGTELVARRGDFSASAWAADREGEHSVASQVQALEHYAHAGGVVLGAFVGDRFVGVGVVVPHLRPGIAQLAFLHVTAASRDVGVGRRLCEALREIALAEGDTEWVVSATPSEHTVRFYLARGFRPMAEPLAELFELEPDDVHLFAPLWTA